MLKQADVDREEERLRQSMASLPDESRARLYRVLQRELKDPDTYAVLNWFFLVGLHHFYLRRWQQGLLDLCVFAVGVVLMASQQYLLGGILLLGLSARELWTLFHSQVIVQDWNNALQRRLLQQELRESALSAK